MSEWKVRFAQPSDAEAFSKWAIESAGEGLVDVEDILAGTSKKNPTVLVFAIEKDGVAQAFAPLYLNLNLAHLGFNPEADGKDKLRAMQMLIDGVSAFAVQFGIREITTLSKPEYPVAKWAVKHDFEMDPRSTFRLNLNKVMESVKE